MDISLFLLVLAYIGVKAEDDCYCGQKNNGGGQEVGSGLVVNGTEVDEVFKYPWTVLVYNSKDSSICTGVFISPTAILSAAHCCQEEDVNTVKLVMTRKMTDNPIPLKWTKISRHPKSASIPYYDMAIFQLENELPCNSYLFPICIPEEDLRKDGRHVHIAGFGQDENGVSGSLREGIGEIKTGDCEDPLLCIKAVKGTANCQGDSGSVSFLLKKGVFYAIGVTSSVTGCEPGDITYCASTYSLRAFITNTVTDLPSPKQK